MKLDLKTIQLAKRKIAAIQYSRINDGPIKVMTPEGRVKLQDGDWLIKIGHYHQTNEPLFCIMPRDTMQFLTLTEDESPKLANGS
jgi:hypothetical protein